MGLVDLSGHFGGPAIGALTETEGKAGAGGGAWTRAWAKTGAGLSPINRQVTDIIRREGILNCFETFERTKHLVEEVHQAPPVACSAGPGVSGGPWTDGGHSDETICGPASLAWCHRHFPYTQHYEHFGDVMA